MINLKLNTLKTNTLKQKSSVFPIAGGMLLLAMLCAVPVHAQLYDASSLFIGDGGEVYLGSGQYYFASGGTTKTTKVGNYGTLSFGADATANGAGTAHFVDGYSRVYGTTEKVLPIGANGVYAPVKVLASTADNAGVSAAYFAANPTAVGTGTDGTVTGISPVEYWVFKGVSPSKISLSWRLDSNITALTGGTLTNLAIAGWNGTAWVIIPATVDTNSFVSGDAPALAEGSITTNGNVTPNAYSAYALATKDGACEALLPASGITKTWDGTAWSPSAPTLYDTAVINAAYSGNLSCNALVLNADITLADDESVEIVNGATGSGKVIMASEASVVQRSNTASAPAIELTKKTRPMRRFDYIFLSSPVDVNNFYADILSAAKCATDALPGTQANGAFSSFKTLAANGDQVTITSFTKGQGFRALVRNQAPYSTSTVAESWYTDQRPIYIKTNGVANNGDVAYTIAANKWLFLGNPYPSAIDGVKLLKAAGADVRQTLYYWTFNTPMSSTFTYNTNDFATWTIAGGVATCANCPTPDGSIASMQAVQIKSSGTAANFSVTNCMRKKTGNDVFFRSAQQATGDRFWLNMTGSGGSFSQVLLTYRDDATTGADAQLDGERNIMQASTRISSLIGTTEYAIQARPVFDITDAVPLAISQVNNEMLTISIGKKEGVFASGQPIYLHDKVLNTFVDLQGNTSAFMPATVYDTNRYEIVYQNTLSNPDFGSEQLLAGIKGGRFSVESATSMGEIQIFDMTGRLVTTYNAGSSNAFSGAFPHEEGVYIAKISLDNHLVVTRKLINRD